MPLISLRDFDSSYWCFIIMPVLTPISIQFYTRLRHPFFALLVCLPCARTIQMSLTVSIFILSLSCIKGASRDSDTLARRKKGKSDLLSVWRPMFAYFTYFLWCARKRRNAGLWVMPRTSARALYSMGLEAAFPSQNINLNLSFGPRSFQGQAWTKYCSPSFSLSAPNTTLRSRRCPLSCRGSWDLVLSQVRPSMIMP
ncbi:hypothetical protein GYMLUDRAFT_779532 [Collybiopsis luxurians FD-317 M1]|uniref:Uncharacterized protein n=1 Tax=Collybiopsis luxurians FD-317 M1 TaxID=944289 RepID=A0A0D0CMZ1_9AGAR|nr:hypothetical protein GYMLUDRAFT_779532 [Collybiopsis luxurians FD-317 M1]